MLHGMQDLSSPARDQTRAPAVGAWSLNHWTTREVPKAYFIPNSLYLLIPYPYIAPPHFPLHIGNH